MKPPAARRLRRAAPVVCAAALLCAVAGAAAQAVYRCGPDGRTYQDEPCAGGRAVDVADPRTDEQRRAASQAAASDARLAAQLERERLAREKAALAAARAGRAGVARTVVVDAASAPLRRHYPYPYRRSSHGARYFQDGTPAPPAYRVPAAPAPARRR